MLKSGKYDFIICGAGCAGLSLLTRMLASGRFDDRKFLLIDKEPKTRNDRTWCFWEEKAGFFEEIVHRRWQKLDFFSDAYHTRLDISPYTYKLIRGIDFYDYCFTEIGKHNNVEIFYGESGGVFHHKDGVRLVLNGKQLDLDHAVVFNSIYRPPENKEGVQCLLQHFKGWIIQTTEPFFSPDAATLMDFRVHQDHGTAFAYLLPMARDKALVEYTLFTKELLKPEMYDVELRRYISDILGINQYIIEEEEFGVIPMTNQQFHFFKDGVYHIGTAGGQTKASSGYTFQFIQKQSRQIVDALTDNRSLDALAAAPKRFRFYDKVMLDVLYREKVQGKKLFTHLFRRNKPQQVLKFLDNESTLKEELKIISSLPTWPFLKAAMRS